MEPGHARRRTGRSRRGDSGHRPTLVRVQGKQRGRATAGERAWRPWKMALAHCWRVPTRVRTRGGRVDGEGRMQGPACRRAPRCREGAHPWKRARQHACSSSDAGMEPRGGGVAPWREVGADAPTTLTPVKAGAGARAGSEHHGTEKAPHAWRREGAERGIPWQEERSPGLHGRAGAEGGRWPEVEDEQATCVRSLAARKMEEGSGWLIDLTGHC
jgi:hypothetical protein